ncbi:MAG: carboxypeptidase regulatory-like domain-containing protein [Gemmatimonadales bacterium]
MNPRLQLALVAVVFAVGSAVSAPSSAQTKSASITGRVVNHSREPVAGARVVMLQPRKIVATDSVGRFAFADLRPGSYRIEASLIGYPPLSALVTVNDGERMDVEFRTDSIGQLLPTIYVEGEPAPELIRVMTTFERRMTHGHGRFITRDEILRRNPMRILDLIRFLPGVRSRCEGLNCLVLLNHDPSGCPPAIFVDEQRTSLSVLDNTPPTDVQGIEIYRGPSETPPELNNDVARCGGAIAIWTRRGRQP